MQILENSLFGLRSARITFLEPERKITVTLFPVIHVAEPAFYKEVYEKAYTADVVLTEGVNTAVTRRLTRAYRYMATRDNGLVLQSKAKPKASEKTRHADVTPEEFVALWKHVPLWLRFVATILAPFVGLKNRWFLNRVNLAKQMEMDDLAPRDMLMSWSELTQPLESALLHARDAHLLDVLRHEVAKAAKGTEIAIIYGAAHMPAVINALPDMGFHWQNSTWMTVFKTE